MTLPRLRHLARERRDLVPVDRLANTIVEHYSIPAFARYGGPVVEPGADIGSDKLTVREGQLLISKLNPRISRVQVVRGLSGGADLAVSSTEFVVLEPLSIDGSWLRWWLSSTPVTAALSAAVKSVTRSQQRVVPDDILNLRPPGLRREQQERVAEFLDLECGRIDDAIVALHRPLTRARDTPGLMLLERITESSAADERLRFGVRRIDQGWSPECWDRSAGEGEWGVLKLGCVNGGTFTYEHKTLPNDLEPRPALAIRPGDLVMSRANTRQLVGSAAVVLEDVPLRLMLSDLLYRVVVDNARWIPDYLAAVMNSRIGRDQIERAAGGAAGNMPKISQEVIKNLRLPRPSIESQVTIGREHQTRTMAVREASLRTAAVHDALLRYRCSLIHEAVTGKLDVLPLSEQQLDERLHAAGEDRLDEVAV